MRPLLVGMNNPLSSRPEHALYPYPPGCTGDRIYQMLCEATRARQRTPFRREYLDAFDRVNLIDGPEWSDAEARLGASRICHRLFGPKVVMLGAKVPKSFNLPRLEWGVWSTVRVNARLLEEPPAFTDEIRYVCLPHPSGRCREYNDPAVRGLAGRILAELYYESAGLSGGSAAA